MQVLYLHNRFLQRSSLCSAITVLLGKYGGSSRHGNLAVHLVSEVLRCFILILQLLCFFADSLPENFISQKVSLLHMTVLCKHKVH